jgi:hypothetical protein
MSPEDVALCQQAIELANSGQTQEAYEQFCTIQSHGNAEDITLLYWLAVTTPKLKEAHYAIDAITRLEPDHPKLQELQDYVDRKEEREKQRQRQEAETEKQRKRQEAEEEEKRKQAETYALQHPILTCPYCHVQAPAAVGRKVTTGGWVFFVVILLASIVGYPLFGGLSLIGILFCWLPLLSREDYYVCSACGIKLGTKLYLFR